MVKDRHDAREALRKLLKAKAPAGHLSTDTVLHRWPEGVEPDPDIVAEARMCMANDLPFIFEGKQWRITWCEPDETDCFSIEGVEWG